MTPLLFVNRKEILLVFVSLIPNPESDTQRQLLSLVQQMTLHFFIHKLEIIYLCRYIYI